MSFKLYEYKLVDLVEIKYGKNQKKVENENGVYPILGTGGVMGYANEYLYDRPSILIGRKGSISKVKYIDEPFWTVDTLFYTKVNEKLVVPKYLYFVLSLIDFNYYNEGTTIPSLRIETLNTIKVSIPNIEVQQKQLTLLEIIEGKLGINKDLIKTLEELSQKLFKRWFIDFEFPNEQGLPYRSSGDEMVESELGKIPKKWKVSTVNDLGDIVGGGTPSKKEEDYYTVNGIPWITPKDLSGNKSKFIYKGNLDISELGLAKSSAKLMPKGTVLLSSRAPIGYIAIAGTDVTTNQGFKSLVPTKGYSEYFIYFKLKEVLPIIEANAGGSTFKEISASGLKAIQIVLPEKVVVEKFHEIIAKLFEQIKNLELEMKSLVLLRDSLLPRLLSGEIEIPDESVVEPS